MSWHTFQNKKRHFAAPGVCTCFHRLQMNFIDQVLQELLAAPDSFSPIGVLILSDRLAEVEAEHFTCHFVQHFLACARPIGLH